jgi:hypothetical protein
MEKVRFKVIINWQGEVHTYYRHANSPNQALRHAIRELARETGYAARFVRDHVMDSSSNRWKVEG